MKTRRNIWKKKSYKQWIRRPERAKWNWKWWQDWRLGIGTNRVRKRRSEKQRGSGTRPTVKRNKLQGPLGSRLVLVSGIGMSQQKGLWTGHRKRRHFYFVSVFFLVLGLVMGVLFKWEMWAARSMREVSEKSEDPKPKWGLNSNVCIIFVFYFYFIL